MYSGTGHGGGIYTTERGGGCVDSAHTGTSAAAPLASGVYALVIQIRPDLSWRDFQYLTVRTSIIVAPQDAGWQLTAAGYHFNHKFGFGTLDTYKTIEVAKTWKRVNPQTKIVVPYVDVNRSLRNGSYSLLQIVNITPESISMASMANLEHITLTVTIKVERRGDVKIKLISPNNIVSVLLPGRSKDPNPSGFNQWTVMTVVHWDESSLGKWTIQFTDGDGKKEGTLIGWGMVFYGQNSTYSSTNLPNPIIYNETITIHQATEDSNLADDISNYDVFIIWGLIAVILTGCCAVWHAFKNGFIPGSIQSKGKIYKQAPSGDAIEKSNIMESVNISMDEY